MNGPREGSVDGPAADRWELFLADASAIADQYREDGWEVLLLEPGDVTPVEDPDHDRFGFSVLAPDSEYETVEALVGGSNGDDSDDERGDAADDPRTNEKRGFYREGRSIEIDAVDVFRHDAGETVFALAVELDEGARKAIAIPIYYQTSRERALLETALERGELPIHVRPLSVERWVTFNHDEPSLFVPGEPES